MATAKPVQAVALRAVRELYLLRSAQSPTAGGAATTAAERERERKKERVAGECE
jgi:hypothetical protein